MNGISLEQARSAQSKLIQTSSVPLSGVGITHKEEGYGLKVNIPHPKYRDDIPAAIDGVPVHTVQVVGQAVAFS